MIFLALALIGVGMGSLAIGSAMIMMGSPEEKAGSAGALEETSYELGAVLGVAILGSISALIYRAELTLSPAIKPLTDKLSWQAHESLGAAVAIAEDAKLPDLARAAGDAFTHSLQITGITGGLIMFVAGAAVFIMTPKGTDISAAQH